VRATAGVLVRAGQRKPPSTSPESPAHSCERHLRNHGDDGTMSRVPQLVEFCKEHNLKMLRWRTSFAPMQHERYVRRVAEASCPRALAVPHDRLRQRRGPRSARCLVRGDLEARSRRWCASIRTASPETFSVSTACDCSELVSRSLAAIAKEDAAFFSTCTTRDAASASRPPKSRCAPPDSFPQARPARCEPARQRMVQHESGIGAQILIDLGLKDIRVLTITRKSRRPEGYGIRIADQVPCASTNPSRRTKLMIQHTRSTSICHSERSEESAFSFGV